MEHQIQIFEVGGSLRDEFLKAYPPGQTFDRDFCAVSPDGFGALLQWAQTHMDKIFLIKEEFLTIRGKIHSGQAIDLVMCRQDGPSTDGRRPDNVTPGTLLDDLSRRDFTMNSMARQVSTETLKPIGPIIDPFNGVRDIWSNQIKCVGNTLDRINEDKLRLLRAVRFSITKQMKLSTDLQSLTREYKPWKNLMRCVSQERIREELNKMFLFSTVNSIEFLAIQCHPIAVRDLFKNIWLKPTLEKKKN